MCTILGACQFAQLKLDPLHIDVNDVSQQKTALLTFNGQPVLPGEVLGIVSGVSQTGDVVPEHVPGEIHFSNYSFMFDFSIGSDGVITIKPKQGLVEVGSYDLRIHNIHDTVTGLIIANLRDSIPAR